MARSAGQSGAPEFAHGVLCSNGMLCNHWDTFLMVRSAGQSGALEFADGMLCSNGMQAVMGPVCSWGAV